MVRSFFASSKLAAVSREHISSNSSTVSRISGSSSSTRILRSFKRSMVLIFSGSNLMVVTGQGALRITSLEVEPRIAFWALDFFLIPRNIWSISFSRANLTRSSEGDRPLTLCWASCSKPALVNSSLAKSRSCSAFKISDCFSEDPPSIELTT